MSQVARYDIAAIRKPEKTPQGFLRADAVLTRSGVFSYRNPDGTIRREYRPPEEVFRADALASFEDAPLTVLHPSRLVDTKTAKQLSVGSVKEAPRRDGTHAIARVIVTDADAIARVEGNELSAVSCGYVCDFDPTPGVSPEGERYDGVQRNIVGNHLALVPAGRAGPEAKIRLDADDAVMVTPSASDPSPPTRERMDSAMPIKIRLDGVDFEASEQLAQAITAAQGKTQARVDELEKKLATQDTTLEQAKARADQADEKAKELQKKLDDATSPESVRKRVDARLELERQAGPILGDEVKLDQLDDAGIKRAVVEKLFPEAKDKLEKASEAYLQARYDAAIESVAGESDSTSKDAHTAARRAAAGAGRRDDTADTIAKARKDICDAWKQPLSHSKDTNRGN